MKKSRVRARARSISLSRTEEVTGLQKNTLSAPTSPPAIPPTVTEARAAGYLLASEARAVGAANLVAARLLDTGTHSEIPYAHTPTHAQTHTHTLTHAHAHTHITHTRTHSHTHTHTHTQSDEAGSSSHSANGSRACRQTSSQKPSF